MEHSTPDTVVLEKLSRYCNIIDVSCLFDTRVVEKERKGGQILGSEMGIEEDLKLQWSDLDFHSNRGVGYNLKEFQPLAR